MHVPMNVVAGMPALDELIEALESLMRQVLEVADAALRCMREQDVEPSQKPV